MRTRQDIDMAYLQELFGKIKLVLEAYKTNHKHFLFKFTDPYRIKPVRLYVQCMCLIDDISVRIHENGPMSSEALNSLCFKRYVAVLGLLKEVTNYLPLKSLLITEMSTQAECQWASTFGDNTTRIHQAFFLLQQQVQTPVQQVEICSIVPSRS